MQCPLAGLGALPLRPTRLSGYDSFFLRKFSKSSTYFRFTSCLPLCPQMLLAAPTGVQLESTNVNLQEQVILSTDGACIGNPGPGGWACVLRFRSHVDEMFGCEAHTTNNRMELQAVIAGLKALKEPCAITISTDSQYVQRGTTEWLAGWKANGWGRSKNTRGSRAVLNQDLWEELDRRIASPTVRWQWVKGHADDADNLRCDFLANRAARQQVSSEGVVRLLNATG